MSAQPQNPPRRPSLAERRKSETRMEIARTAARLFATHGTSAVTADQIASESGVALRTFYRYARTKEESVEPLLAAGAQRWLAEIAEGPHRLPTLSEFEAAAAASMTPHDDHDDLEITKGLLRAMDTDPVLRAIWHRINLESERDLHRILTELAGPQADPFRIRLTAAAAAGAVRVALELWAATDGPAEGKGSPTDLVRRCLRELQCAARRCCSYWRCDDSEVIVSQYDCCSWGQPDPGDAGEGGKQPRQRRDVSVLPNGAGPASVGQRRT
ncbi:TetR/AcrR family transcriptional regulator [Nocardia seriolae]|nr:TetR family transcriptional regulator [Nocardia seriolae]MTK39830.1 TetR family transcriptional regulator [Nocardia seriolae]RLP29054.1 TetR/AcrR family transcriptional regulator [Nocardia seriolae]BEK90131.1 TetR family transcriptional regulator [Nocardia seriolae]BEK94038.1 TetR family transcriptional regulator [Nocardia seriolae]